MSNQDVSQFGLGVNRKIFILGRPSVSKPIEKQLNSLSFLVSAPCQELFVETDRFHVVVAPCDFADETQVKVVMRSMLRINNPFAHKVIYCLKPAQPRIDQLLFGVVLEGNYVAFGPEKDFRLRTYLKRVALQQPAAAGVALIESQLEEAIAQKNNGFVRKIYHKLNTLNKDQGKIIELKIKACIVLGQQQKALFLLKRLLEVDPQNLWAVNTVSNIYLKNNQGKKGLEFLTYDSELGGCGPLEDQPDSGFNCLNLLKNQEFPESVKSFLDTRAALALQCSDYDEALVYYRFAEQASFKNPVGRAKVLYNMGLIYLKVRNIAEAKNCFEQSVELGGNKFNKAIKSLDSLKTMKEEPEADENQDEELTNDDPESNEDKSQENQDDEDLSEVEIY